MIDYTEIAHDSDGWEQFARDFLAAKGFYIESTVDRGPDHGKDMLVTERLGGMLGKYQLRWLVSCKHLAKSGKSVSEADEPNILERLAHFHSDGFIGFYSTLASSGLNARLKALRDGNHIKDYSIMDGRLIENSLVTAGYSHLVMRYFPKSYRIVKPLHLLLDEYIPLKCRICKRDLLMDLYSKRHCGNIVYSEHHQSGKPTLIKSVYVVCKGTCDDKCEKHEYAKGRTTRWSDLDDLSIPIEFLSCVISTISRLRDRSETYTEEAFEQLKVILLALAQLVLRGRTEEERNRFLEISDLSI